MTSSFEHRIWRFYVCRNTSCDLFVTADTRPCLGFLSSLNIITKVVLSSSRQPVWNGEPPHTLIVVVDGRQADKHFLAVDVFTSLTSEVYKAPVVNEKPYAPSVSVVLQSGTHSMECHTYVRVQTYSRIFCVHTLNSYSNIFFSIYRLRLACSQLLRWTARHGYCPHS